MTSEMPLWELKKRVSCHSMIPAMSMKNIQLW